MFETTPYRPQMKSEEKAINNIIKLGLLVFALLLTLINFLDIELLVNRQFNISGISRLISLEIYGWSSLMVFLVILLTRNSIDIINKITISSIFILIGSSYIKYYYAKENYVIYQSLIRRYKDVTYLSNDWWLNVSEKINGYYGFTKFFSLFPLELIPILFYIIWIGSIVAYGWIFIHISKKLFNKNKYLLFGMISFIIGVVSYRIPIKPAWGLFALGDNDYLYSFLNPQTIGLVFGFISLFLLLDNKYIWSGISIGLSIIFHINTGQHFLIISFMIALFLKSIDFKQYLITVIFGFLVGTPNLLPIILDQLSTKEPSQYSFIMISGGFRHPHHLLPSTWPFIHYLFFFSLLVLAVLGYIKKDNKNSYDQAFVIILYSSAILLLCGWIFVEIVPIDFIGKSQLFRLTVILKIILIPYAVYFLLYILNRIKHLLIDVNCTIKIKYPMTKELLPSIHGLSFFWFYHPYFYLKYSV